MYAIIPALIAAYIGLCIGTYSNLSDYKIRKNALISLTLICPFFVSYMLLATATKIVMDKSIKKSISGVLFLYVFSMSMYADAVGILGETISRRSIQNKKREYTFMQVYPTRIKNRISRDIISA